MFLHQPRVLLCVEQIQDGHHSNLVQFTETELKHDGVAESHPPSHHLSGTLCRMLFTKFDQKERKNERKKLAVGEMHYF